MPIADVAGPFEQEFLDFRFLEPQGDQKGHHRVDHLFSGWKSRCLLQIDSLSRRLNLEVSHSFGEPQMRVMVMSPHQKSSGIQEFHAASKLDESVENCEWSKLGTSFCQPFPPCADGVKQGADLLTLPSQRHRCFCPWARRLGGGTLELGFLLGGLGC